MSYKISKKELDLLAAYNRKDGSSQLSNTMKIMAVPMILVGIIAIAFGTIYLMKMDMTDKLNNAILDNEVIQLKIDSTDQKPYNELHSLESIYTSLEQLDNSLSGLPTLTKKSITYLKTDLLNGISLKTISFDRNTNLLTASLTSQNVQNIEKYVTTLKKHSEYTDVSYSGYQINESKSIDTTGLVDENGNPIIVEQAKVDYGFNVKISLDKKVGE